VYGTPRLITDEKGPAIQFDGIQDGFQISENPIEGWSAFTLEVNIRPDADGPPEQRFFHIQEEGPGARALLETRVTPDGHWVLDGFLWSKGTGLTLIDRKLQHDTGSWHWAALRYDGKHMAIFVDGKKELEGEIEFAPMKNGRMSLGVRLNKVYWYKGAIREVRLTPSALPDDQLAR
jgi:hypothetical protein